MAKTAARIPGLYMRGSTYWLRIVCPQELQHLNDGKRFSFHSTLDTQDPAEARVRAMAKRTEFERLWHTQRQQLAPPRLAAIPAALREVIAQTVYAAEVALDEAERLDKARTTRAVSGVTASVVPIPDEFDLEDPAAVAALVLGAQSPPEQPAPSRLAPLPPAVRAARDALNLRRAQIVAGAVAAGDLEAILPIAKTAAKHLGLSIDWESEDGAKTLHAALNAYARARSGAVQRDTGAVIETPAMPTPRVTESSASSAPGSTKAPKVLRDILPLWVARARPGTDSVERTERALRLLEKSGHNYPLVAMRRGHGFAFQSWLLDDARSFGGKTAKNYAGCISALLNVAVQAEAIDRHPWPGLADFEVKDSEKREPFTAEELGALFGSSLFRAAQWPTVQKVDPEDAYYGLILSLWSGARVGEIAQLEVADVQTANGVEILDIHGRAGTVKTAESIRKIPLAAEAIRLGFLEFAQARRDSGSTKLFPSFHRPGKVSPGELFSEWFKVYRAEVGAAPGSLNGHHRFRHTIRSELAAIHIGPETADMLTGHAATGSSGRRVYTHVTPATVREALDRLDFKLELPRVFRKPKAS